MQKKLEKWQRAAMVEHCLYHVYFWAAMASVIMYFMMAFPMFYAAPKVVYVATWLVLVQTVFTFRCLRTSDRAEQTAVKAQKNILYYLQARKIAENEAYLNEVRKMERILDETGVMGN